MLAALDATDAVVVGQSLGGAVAIQLLMDHPERLGGAVLIDPTPINEPRVAGMLSRGLRIAAPVTRLPGLNDSLTSRSAHRLERRLGPFDAETKACVSSMFGSASIGTTARALTTFAQDSAVLTARLTPAAVPVTLLSADRPESHRVRLAHRALAQQLGATFTSWPGSEHAMHLQFPQQLADEVTSLLPSSHEQDRSKHR